MRSRVAYGLPLNALYRDFTWREELCAELNSMETDLSPAIAAGLRSSLKRCVRVPYFSVSGNGSLISSARTFTMS